MTRQPPPRTGEASHPKPARPAGSAAAFRPRAPGFTLTETVVVMVLLGILAAIAVPRFLMASDYQERFFYDDVRGALRYARVLAVGSGCEVQVDFSATGYRLLQRTGCSSGSFGQDVSHPGTGAPTYDGAAPSGVTVASSVDPLIFDPLGRSKNTSDAIVSATVTIGSRSLITEGESGYVHVP